MHITSTHRPGSDVTVGEHSISIFFTYDHARSIYVIHSNERESVFTYPHRPIAEALVNAVDVVKRLHDPTDQVLNV